MQGVRRMIPWRLIKHLRRLQSIHSCYIGGLVHSLEVAAERDQISSASWCPIRASISQDPHAFWLNSLSMGLLQRWEMAPAFTPPLPT